MEEARARRQVPAPVGVGEARGQIDAAIRACLDAQATIIGQPGTGAHVVIGKVQRGADCGGLVAYLFGPGRHNEHTDQHVVAHWTGLPGEVVAVGADGQPDLAPLVADLKADLRAAGLLGAEGSVWHCSVAIPATDGTLARCAVAGGGRGDRRGGRFGGRVRGGGALGGGAPRAAARRATTTSTWWPPWLGAPSTVMWPTAAT